MAVMRIFKETALPGSLVANAVYLVTASNADYVEMYVTSNTGVARRIIDESDIQTMITAAVAGIAEVRVVADIAARNALALTANAQVLVLNATGDATVASGAATYVWNNATTTWTKISEAESMDLAVAWTSITGRPSSSPAAIDLAVTNSHTHANLTQLNLIGQDAGGDLTYNGQNVRARLETAGW
ncbi:MAG: hypothetical protein ACRDAM_15730 [Casimicrobium sp.]